jgi:hypothetical protein
MDGRAMNRQASQPLAPASAEPDVAALVRDLRQLYYVKGIELMLRVGELILERLYEGDESKWKSRSRKDYSFRKLEQHPDLPFKAPMLSRAVSMYVLSRRRADLLALQNVSQTHLQEVLNLDPELQDALLSRVEQEKWSVQRLRAEVVQSLPRVTTKRPGRPRSPAYQKHLRNMKNIVEGRLLVMDAASVAVLQSRETQELLDAARRLCQQAEIVTRVLAAHLNTLERGQPAAAKVARLPRVSEIRPAGISPTKHAS